MGKLSQRGYLVLRAVADTHAVIWYLFGDKRLSINANNFISQVAANGDQIAFASITLAEIVYLTERGRIPFVTFDRLIQAMDGDDALLVEIAFNRNIAQALLQVDRHQVKQFNHRLKSVATRKKSYGLNKVYFAELNNIPNPQRGFYSCRRRLQPAETIVSHYLNAIHPLTHKNPLIPSQKRNPVLYSKKKLRLNLI